MIEPHRFQIYRDKAGEYRVRFRYRGQTIFATEGYIDRSEAKRMIERIKKYVMDAPVEDA